jgi:hypothetical protein
MGTLFVDNIKHESAQGSGTITLGASGETIALASGASVTGNGLVGITEADQWQVTSGTAVSADTDTVITSGWSRAVPTTFNYIGSGMSQSSGVFTFPNTGIYLVTFNLVTARSGSTRYFEARINATTDNSSYSLVGQSTGFINQVSGGTLSTATFSTFVDVTDTSNVKVKFSTIADEAIDVTSNPNYVRTNASFIRLGDT